MQSLECKDYRELITAAVDGELSTEEKLLLDTHLESCASCRSEYDVETSLKGLVKQRIRMVPTPSLILRRIVAALLGDQPVPSNSWTDRLRLLLARPLVRPALALAATAFVVYILFNRSGEVDVLRESVAIYEEVVSGAFPLQEASGQPAILRRFFAGRTTFPVIIPEMMDCTLLGGVLNDHPGGALAHVVYDHHAKKIYLYQTSWVNVERGEGSTVSSDIREELLRAGWCARISPEGHTVVLWHKGATLCVAVSDLSRDDLLMCLTSVDATLVPR